MTVIKLGWFNFPETSFKALSFEKEAIDFIWRLIPDNAQLMAEYYSDDGMETDPNLVSSKTRLSKEQAVPVVQAWVKRVKNRYDRGWKVRRGTDGLDEYSFILITGDEEILTTNSDSEDQSGDHDDDDDEDPEDPWSDSDFEDQPGDHGPDTDDELSDTETDDESLDSDDEAMLAMLF